MGFEEKIRISVQLGINLRGEAMIISSPKWD